MKTPAPSSARRPRLAWIDLFRGAAVLVMIETHVVNTFLATALRAEPWFAVLNYVNGLVAPSFLFVAGFMQGMERRISPDKPVNYPRRARRLPGLLALGYALHFPWKELAEHRWADALRVGSQVDVLQCLAVSLGMVLTVRWVAEKFGSPMLWKGGLVALTAVVVLAAPWASGLANVPVPLWAWMNVGTGSWFPLFPWAGFVLLGALAGAWPEQRLRERATGILSLLAVAWLCRIGGYSPVSPASFLERIVWVLVLAAIAEWSVSRRVPPAVMLFAGKHSLVLYVTHLLLISTLVGIGVPSSLAMPGVLGLLAAVGAISLGLTLLVSRWPFSAVAVRPIRAPATSESVS